MRGGSEGEPTSLEDVGSLLGLVGKQCEPTFLRDVGSLLGLVREQGEPTSSGDVGPLLGLVGEQGEPTSLEDVGFPARAPGGPWNSWVKTWSNEAAARSFLEGRIWRPADHYSPRAPKRRPTPK